MVSVLDFLRKKGLPYIPRDRKSGQTAVMKCPWCGGDDFGISTTTGAWSCVHKNKCGKTGSWWDFMEHFGETRPEKKIRCAGAKTYTRPKPKKANLHPDALKYLIETRKLFQTTIDSAGLFSPPASDSIGFPFDRGGFTENVKYRHRAGKEPWKKFEQEKNALPCLYGRDHVPSDATEIIICEGEIDCLSLWQYGYHNTVSIPSGVGNHEWLQHEWDWLKRFGVVYLALDSDAAGEADKKTLAARMDSWRCFLVTLPEKDANKCLQLGHPPERIQEAFLEAEEYRPAILSDAYSFRSEVEMEMDIPYEGNDGKPMGFQAIDGFLRGIRPGELTVHNGANGSGKSTLALQVLGRLLYLEATACLIASMEILPAQSLAVMVRQALREKAFNKEKRSALFEEWKGRLFILNHYGAIEPSMLLECMTYAAKRYGVKLFLIDSLMRIKLLHSDTNRAQSEIVGSLKDFAMVNRAHAWLVVHPRKGETDSQDKGKVDVRGASEITDLADNVLLQTRPSEDELKKAGNNILLPSLRVQKNRKHGLEGRCNLVFYPSWKGFSQEGKDAEVFFNV